MGQMTYSVQLVGTPALSFVSLNRIEVPMHIALRRFMPLLLLAPGLALAHPSLDHALSFAAGISHPFGGLDHLLAMVAVGMLGARLKGRAVWMLPLTFMTMLAVGAAIGIGRPASSLIEIAVAASVILFGLVLGMKHEIRSIAAVIVVGTFAVAHGYAHGTEAISGNAAGYIGGMLIASAVLHTAGIVTVLRMTRLDRDKAESALRLAGALIALAGAGVMFG
jgi:urease accessory protein